MPPSHVLESGNILFDPSMFCTPDAEEFYSVMSFFICLIQKRKPFAEGEFMVSALTPIFMKKKKDIL